MSSQICVDASLVLKLVLAEPESETVEAQWQSWLRAGVEIIAPTLLPYEATSAIRKHVHRGLISDVRGAAAVSAFLALADSILLIPPDGLHSRAWELAGRHQQPRLYDAYYVALAESLNCPLWTADERLRHAMPDAARFIFTLPQASNR